MPTQELMFTYNVKFGEKLPQLLEWFAGLNIPPAIANFQEFPDPNVGGYGLQLNQLGYEYRFAPALVKQGRQFGELTAVRDEYQILSNQTIGFGLNPLEKNLLRLKGERSALLTTIQMKDYILQVANVHILLLGLFRHRWRQVRQVLDRIDPQTPTAVVGDFNNGSIDRLFGRNKLVENMEKAKMEEVKHKGSTFFCMGRGFTIDGVFAKDLAVFDAWTERIGLSDHEPLFVKFANSVV